jgi:hypothetical protein
VGSIPTRLTNLRLKRERASVGKPREPHVTTGAKVLAEGTEAPLDLGEKVARLTRFFSGISDRASFIQELTPNLTPKVRRFVTRLPV